jgi:multiple antibiotic resistance protein
MGFEMTAGGAPTRVQGGAESRDAPSADDHLLVPFAMPFIAGPGAITTVITLSSQTGHTDAVAMSLVAIGVAILTLAFSLFFLTDFLMKIPERAMKVITRFGGLLIATIGVQLALNGIKVFFGL